MIRGDALLKILGVGPSQSTHGILRSFLLPYLADWKSALDNDVAISDIEWQHVAWGPYSTNIIEWISFSSARFDAISTQLNGSESDIQIVSFIKERYLERDMPSLVSLVRSTFPLQFTKVGDKLPLVELARRYKRDFRQERSRRVVA